MTFITKSTYRNGLIGASAIALVMSVSSVASAQTAPAVDCTKQENATNPACQKAETVTVVGSRIRRNEFNSSSPIQIITSEDVALQGKTETSNIIQTSTAAAGSQQINSTFTGFITEGGPGANTVSLRGLGATRSLVLINGKRIPPSGTRGQVGAVDLNSIPNSMIAGYEFLKDGASTIYGSDAIGGVINLITRKNQKGGRIQGSYNFTEHGGGETLTVDGSYGWNFDRGNILIGAEYFDRKILKAGDRDWAGCQEDMVYNTDGSRADMIDPDTGSFACFNQWQGTVRVLGGANRGEWVPTPGSTTGPVPGWTLIRNQNTANGPLTPASTYLTRRPYYTDRNKERSIYSPVTRSSIYATADYRLPFGEDLRVTSELLFNRRESSQTNYRQIFGFNGQNIPAADTARNPFGGPADTVALFPFSSRQTVDTTRFNVGIKGGFGNWSKLVSDWEWEVYGQMGLGEGEYQQDVMLLAQFNAATAGCPVGSPAGCLPFNWLSPQGILTGAWDPAQVAYFTANDIGNTTYKQNIIEASMNGTLFALPAGDLKFSAGLHYRTESIDDIPGPASIGNNLAGSTGAQRTKGEDKVREGFLELDIPVLRDLPLIDRLTVNASTRLTDYDSYGSDTVYKVGVNWAITPQVRITATQGTNYRAPALFELFLGNQTGFLGQGSIDPCIGLTPGDDANTIARCTSEGVGLNYLGTGLPYPGVGASATIFTGGGAGALSAETAENKTLGITWTPTFADLKVNVTHWDILIENAVRNFGAGTIMSLCYTGRVPAACNLYTRNQTAGDPDFGRILTVRSSYINVAAEKGRGIDLEMQYRKEFSFGKFGWDLSSTWSLEHWDDVLGDVTDYEGAVYEPIFVGNSELFLKRGDWTYYWDMDMVGRASNYGRVNQFYAGVDDTVVNRPGTAIVKVKAHTEATITHNASVRYQSDNWSVQVGVQNIFDENPPTVSGLQTVGWYTRLGNSILGGPYDLMGRRAYIDLRKKF